MSATDGYTRSGRFAERGDVVVDRAVDPITGLPVLVYRFPGAPVAAAAAIDSDDVWKVLDHGVDEGGGYLVTNLVQGAEPLDRRPSSLDDHVAERACTAVAAAGAAGATHGDLGAHRVYRRAAQVWLEGYGAPWSDEATPADDARALARSLLALRGALSPAAQATLRRAAEDGDASAAGAALRDLAADDAREPPGAPRTATSDEAAERSAATARRPRNAASEAFGEVRIEASMDTTPPASTPPSASTPWRAAPQAWEPAEPRAARAPRAAGPRFSKAPPPDVTYRSGDDARDRDVPDRVAAVVASVRDRRRVWLLGLLVVAAMALALVTVLGQRDASPERETIGAGGSYVVDVRVEPTRLPPVSLVVVSSPPGSRHGAGTVIRTVPDKVVLDREGTWQFQGRFEGRRSEIVTIAVPRDQTVVLPFTDIP